MISRLAALSVLLLGFTAAAHADGNVKVTASWVRATAGKTGAAYLTLRNDGDKPDRLTAVSADVAKASLHETTKDGNVMKMRDVAGIDIPAHGSVTFKPEGYHVMLENLKGPLKQGGSVALTFTLRDAGKVEATAPVLAAGAKGPDGAPGGSMAHDMSSMPGMDMKGMDMKDGDMKGMGH